jgi:hypothetical protein
VPIIIRPFSRRHPFAHRGADFVVAFAVKTIGSSEAAKIGDRFDIPSRTCGISYALRAVQHIKLLHLIEVLIPTAKGSRLDKVKKTRAHVECHDSVRSSGETTLGDYHVDHGIQSSFHLRGALRPVRQ